jgi:hypothetical protein
VILSTERRYGFWGALCVTSGFIFIMNIDDFFPDEEFFPGIGNIHDNMGDNNGNSCCGVSHVVVKTVF